VKGAMKKGLFGASYLLVFPLTAMGLFEKWCLKKSGLFCSLAQLLSLVPGKIGSYLRVGFYLHNLDKCSWESSIGFGSFFSHREAIVGRHVTIGAFAIIGRAVLEENVKIASRVSITSGNRQHLDASGGITPETHLTEVRIGAGSWIGEGAIVMADIGAGCIIGAGSVVVKPIPANATAVGNPARIREKG
jgi:acetyltransferase-like isoleucine patch superfamily enzyme